MSEVENKYRLCIVATHRARQLAKGARARVWAPETKVTKIAIKEVEEGKVEFEVLGEPKARRRARSNDE